MFSISVLDVRDVAFGIREQVRDKVTNLNTPYDYSKSRSKTIIKRQITSYPNKRLDKQQCKNVLID